MRGEADSIYSEQGASVLSNLNTDQDKYKPVLSQKLKQK